MKEKTPTGKLGHWKVLEGALQLPAEVACWKENTAWQRDQEQTEEQQAPRAPKRVGGAHTWSFRLRLEAAGYLDLLSSVPQASTIQARHGLLKGWKPPLP